MIPMAQVPAEPNFALYFLIIAGVGIFFSIFLFFQANRKEQSEGRIMQYEKTLEAKDRTLQQTKEEYEEVKGEY